MNTKRKRPSRKLARLLALLLACWLLSGCAITHRYGPYMGKVVDKETNEPIGGAVVFMQFFTYNAINPAGQVSTFAGAVEVLTDEQGEFHIDPEWVFVFRPLHVWDRDSWVIVFKPGYGAFPGNWDTDSSIGRSDNLPRKEYVTIQLPKLKTREERIDNQGHSTAYNMDDVPCRKQLLILKLYNQERRNLGFDPEMTSCFEDTNEN